MKKQAKQMGFTEMIMMLGMALFSLIVIVGGVAFAGTLIWKSIFG